MQQGDFTKKGELKEVVKPTCFCIKFDAEWKAVGELDRRSCTKGSKLGDLARPGPFGFVRVPYLWR